MKTFLRILIPALLLVIVTGCDAFKTLTESRRKTAQGRPYELIVVCPQQQWDSQLGDSLRTLLAAPIPYLNQTEPLFDVLRVTERGFTGMIADHRNVLQILISPKVEQASVGVQYDVTAEPQVILTLQAPSDQAAIDYLAAHGQDIVLALEMAERDRATAYSAKFNEQHIKEVIQKTFGVEMDVPKGYVLAKEESDFIWARYELPEAGQGFALYSYPYTGNEDLTPHALLEARNKFMARIPGPADASYMTTSPAYEPDFRIFRLDGRLWCEMRGFWDVENDFMGGPFVSYSTVDTATNRVLTLDCYVYSPKNHKRNMMRSAEHLLYMLHFPAK